MRMLLSNPFTRGPRIYNAVSRSPKILNWFYHSSPNENTNTPFKSVHGIFCFI